MSVKGPDVALHIFSSIGNDTVATLRKLRQQCAYLLSWPELVVGNILKPPVALDNR